MTNAGTPRGEGRVPSHKKDGRRDEADHRSYRHDHEQDARQHEQQDRQKDHIDKSTAQSITGGSTLEVIAGAGAVTLGVLGLAGIMPSLFTVLSVIAVGGGLMFAGGSIAAKYRDVLSTSGGRHSKANLAETGGGISAQTVGGAAGVALGILALVGVLPATLTSVGIIVLGGALMFGAAATRRLSNVIIESSGAAAHKQRVASESVRSSAAMQTVTGLAAAALGVLTLVGVGVAGVLNLAAAIVLGAGLLLSGMAVGGEMVTMLYRNRDQDRQRRRQHRREPGYSSAE